MINFVEESEDMFAFSILCLSGKCPIEIPEGLIKLHIYVDATSQLKLHTKILDVSFTEHNSCDPRG